MMGFVVVTLASAVSGYWIARPEIAGTNALYLWLWLAQLPFALLALFFVYRSGDLKARIQPKPGDVLRGVSLAFVLVIAIWAERALLMPHGSIREAWLARLYIQMGDPLELEKSWWLPLVIISWAVNDELVWRTWLQGIAVKRFGNVRGIGVTTLCYAVAAIPSATLLADPTAGFNPLVVILAIAGGIAWGYVTYLTGRATPAMLSHATLAYFTILQFRPGL